MGMHKESIQSALFTTCLLVGKEIALLLDLELGSTCQNDAISMFQCNQLSFENWSVSYVTNMKLHM